MKRKLFWWSLAAAVAVGVLMLIPSCRLTVVGLFRGEHFYAGRPTGYWLYLLKTGNEGEQRQAADALAAVGPEASPGLIDVIEYGDSRAAGHAAYALGKMGPAAGPAAVAVLVGAVRDDEYGLRGALKGMGAAGTEALLPLLDDPDPAVRERAVNDLGDFGPQAAAAVPKLVGMLRTEDRGDHASSDVISSLRHTLPAIGAPAVPALTELLESGDPVLRGWAIQALGDIGPDAAPAEPALLRLADQGFDFMRVGAADAVCRIDPKQAERVLPVLRQGLGKVVAFDTTSPAADALGRIGKPAVPTLLDVLKTGNTAARADAARALGKVGPDAADAVPALAEALHDPEPSIRRAALEGLGGVGPAAASATKELMAVYKEDNRAFRQLVADDVRHIGPGARASSPLMIDALKSDDKDLRRYAAQALGAMGSEAADATPALTAALSDESTRLAAAEALWRIEGQKGPLLDLLRDPKEEEGAVSILERIGPTNDWVVPALADDVRRHTVTDNAYALGSEMVRPARVLANFGPAARPAAPALVAAINRVGPNDSDRIVLTECLAKIDPEAAAALDRPNYGLIAGVLVGLAVPAGAWVWWRRKRKQGAAARAAASRTLAEVAAPGQVPDSSAVKTAEESGGAGPMA